MSRLDVLTLGRVGVDVYPLEVGAGLRALKTLGRRGSATHVPAPAARCGKRARQRIRLRPFGGARA